jgi:hypothetical protein
MVVICSAFFKRSRQHLPIFVAILDFQEKSPNFAMFVAILTLISKLPIFVGLSQMIHKLLPNFENLRRLAKN